ncbi:hypothetical protein Scep_019098 [Stephania cephalantha]|uniref:Uncharacterized protein n=1 Tax=Stephania cephalantha TaxID=152367 RepID=A0AAP0NMI8_9MAGN
MSVIITVYVESDTCNNIRRRNKPTTNHRSSINNNNAITNHHHQVRRTKPLLTKPTILSSSNKFPTLMPRSSHGFDRKAQLLAYAQELRKQYYNSKSINSWQAPMNNFPNNRPKTKW